MTGRDLLIALSVKYDNKWDRMYQAIKEREVFTEEQVSKLVKKAKAVKYTILDSNYPDKYKHNYNRPPFVVYK